MELPDGYVVIESGFTQVDSTPYVRICHPASNTCCMAVGWDVEAVERGALAALQSVVESRKIVCDCCELSGDPS